MSEKSGGTGHAPKSIDTLIGAGMRIEGDVVCDGVLRVQGDIVGNVSRRNNPNATLIVDSAGSVTGAVDMPRVAVRGRVLGPVQSGQAIEVHQGGSLEGDIAFNRIAIHAGGVVVGLLSPTAEPERKPAQKGSDEPAMPGADGNEAARRRGTAWTLGVTSAAIAVVAASAWMVRRPQTAVPSAEEAAPSASVSSAPATPYAAASVTPSVAAPPAVVPPPAPVPQDPPAAAQEAAPAPETETQEKEKPQGKIVAVRGINPSRPAGVFLLISNESSVLYRKMRDEPGEGAKVVVPAGEKASVAVAPNELIRVAQGRDVVILFQGAKVPRNIIESGSWISFVPK